MSCLLRLHNHVCAIKNDVVEIFPKLMAADLQHEAGEETLAAFRGFLHYLPDAKNTGVVYGTSPWNQRAVYPHSS